MNKKKQIKLEPKYRFPEFANDIWKIAKLKYLFSNRQESGFLELPLMSLTDELGIIPQSYSNKRDNSNSDKSKYLRICRGDIVYNTMRMWQGRCAYSEVEGIVSPAYTVCTPKDGNVGLFFYYYFKTDNLIKKFRSNSQGLVSDTLNLKYNAFSVIEVAYPNQVEQQKIADCLSSIDDLIFVEDKKLSTLKYHKKGLMQKLFPAEGKTVPEWRFPEFNDCGEWDYKSLKTISDMQAGRFIAASQIYTQLGDSMYPCYGGNGLRGYTKTFTHSGEYSLVGRQGALCGNINYATGDFYATEHAVVVTAKEKTVARWLYYLLIHLNLNQYATGQAQPGLSVQVIEKLKVWVPKDTKEQQKTADLLSSVDELITAQADKIEALKKHKKGLMQGLFPSIEEVIR